MTNTKKQPSSPLNQPKPRAKRRLVTRELLIERARSNAFSSLQCLGHDDVERDALLSSVQVEVLGWPQTWQLHFCVEWDSMRVLVGYSKQAQFGARWQAGLDDWFVAASALPAELELKARSIGYSLSDYLREEPGKFQDIVLEAALQAQACLDAVPMGDEHDEAAMDKVKDQVRSLLSPLGQEGWPRRR